MKASVKNIVAGCMLALSAAAAQAVTVPEIIFDEDGSGGFSATVKKGITSFSGVWNFVVPSASQAAGSVTSTRISAGVKDLELTAFYITGVSGTFSGTMEETGKSEQWIIDAFNISAGSYELYVSGNVIASNNVYNGGSFGGQLDLAAPVPEPATWGMMLGGLAMVGSYARRRNTVKNSQASSGVMLAA